MNILRRFQGRKKRKELVVLAVFAVVLAALTIALVVLGSTGTEIGGAVSGVASAATLAQFVMGIVASQQERPSAPELEVPTPPARWRGIPSASRLSDRTSERLEAAGRLALAPVTALAGPGGFGKTALAALLCEDVRGLFPGGGQWFYAGRDTGDREIAEMISSVLPGSREPFTRPAPAAATNYTSPTLSVKRCRSLARSHRPERPVRCALRDSPDRPCQLISCGRRRIRTHPLRD